jgi:homoserine kinase
MGNVGGLTGLYTQDYDLIRSFMMKSEPLRSVLIPGFDLIKKTAMENGALGSGISGSGPSIFALSKGRDTADKVAKAMSVVYDEMKLPYEIHVSKVNPDGMRIL